MAKRKKGVVRKNSQANKKRSTPCQVKKTPVVRKSNIFIDGQYRFGLHEQKILLLIISQVKTDQKEFVPYRVSWDEIKQVSKGKLNTVKKINTACEKLKNKTISIETGEGTDNFGFLSGWRTVESRFVEFRIDPGMKEMLLGLLQDGNFTLYQLEFALALPSSHAIRMYEVLKSHFWKKQPVLIVLDDLKRSLDIPLNSKTYSDFGNFRQFILERSKKNLTEYTDITFTYKTIKDGRRVGSVEFHIKENKKYQKTVQAAVARDLVRSGDTVLIAGEECFVDGSACFYHKKAIPIGELNQMLKKGQIELLEVGS